MQEHFENTNLTNFLKKARRSFHEGAGYTYHRSGELKKALCVTMMVFKTDIEIALPVC